MRKKNNLSIKILYLVVHKRLYTKYGRRNILSIKDFFAFLGEMYRVPKNLRAVILREMEILNMIEKINRREIKILPLFTDPEENVNKFYDELGLFD